MKSHLLDGIVESEGLEEGFLDLLAGVDDKVPGCSLSGMSCFLALACVAVAILEGSRETRPLISTRPKFKMATGEEAKVKWQPN